MQPKGRASSAILHWAGLDSTHFSLLEYLRANHFAYSATLGAYRASLIDPVIVAGSGLGQLHVGGHYVLLVSDGHIELVVV